jgi:hypothetical protein
MKLARNCMAQSQGSPQFAVIFDPDNGFQLLNVATGEVADLAVLESTWRKLGEMPSGEVTGQAMSVQPKGQPVPQANPPFVQKMTTMQYGALRIRSTGALAYDIADPRVSLRDDQAPQP